VQDFGLQRLQDVFGQKPVEYPATRTIGASLIQGARDVMAAFPDPKINAILTSIGIIGYGVWAYRHTSAVLT